MTLIQTVTGPIDHTGLGLVLPHEHLVNDLARAFTPAADPQVRTMLAGPVTAELAPVLREHPYNSKDNCSLHDAAAVVEDLCAFRAAGGDTVIDLTPPGLGRDPEALLKYSEASGVQVVMGSGWYLQKFQAGEDLAASEEELTEQILADFRRPGVRPGVIGEIGVSPSFTAAEEKSLRAASRAQLLLGVPLFIHLPGWLRVGHRVLDIVVNECGVRPEAVVLCHMDPSSDDPGYQLDLAKRGTYLCFDMIGMPYSYPGEGISPAPEQAAKAVARLIDAGHRDRILLSHDVFLKGMLSSYGGNGFGFVPSVFPRFLAAHGVSRQTAMELMTRNPAQLFVHSHHL